MTKFPILVEIISFYLQMNSIFINILYFGLSNACYTHADSYMCVCVYVCIYVCIYVYMHLYV